MRLPAAIGVGLLAVALAGSSSFAYDICTDLADCQRKAEADIAAGQYEQALEALVAVADLAAGEGDDARSLFAFESLTAINLKVGKPLMAHAWAQAALIRFEGNSRARANLENAKQALGAASPAGSISGTYESYAGHGYWSELKILEQEPGKVRTKWFMMRFGAVPSAWDYGPAAMWELSADGRYSNGELVITYEGSDGSACELAFKRTKLAIEWVSPTVEDFPRKCRTGGANVLPFGPFWLVDSAAPDFGVEEGPTE
jgi:hypothetical protein